MSVDDAVKEVRRLVWVADLDHRQIVAVEVVCAATEASGPRLSPERNRTTLSRPSEWCSEWSGERFSPA